ncbi:MAG: chloride channel protein [Prevotella sp.]|nr:chloride channel protein [Prevotella sp.]MDD7606222.1 chloride channel protein [Prevotellaceae bacterium]MDY3247599.1 chloride channel protein [Prevotella sp.]
MQPVDSTSVADRSAIVRFVAWSRLHVSERQTILILSFFIGLFAAIAAFVLHSLIHQVQLLLTTGFTITSYNWLYLLFPVIGIYLTSLFIKYVVKDNISHGITRVLYAISTKKSHLKSHNCWSSVIASAITIGFGGSVGAEAPIVLTGSAIGSNLGQLFHVEKKNLILLVGCGAAAAIAGIFKAPIAGLVFTLEVLMVDLSMASLLPILISCVTATCFSYIFMGGESLFSFHVDNVWGLDKVPANILLGLFCGMVSLYFMRTMTACENGFAQLAKRPYLRLLVGGLVLSPLIFLFPSLYGEGYSAINILLNGKTPADWNTLMNNSIFYGHGNLLIVYVGLVILTKVFATSATNGGGGCGGTFAPSLFIGGFSGFFFSRLWNTYQVGVYIPDKNFTLLGMAGVMAGVMHAPLTGIFLIAELTGGYQLFMPLIIVSVVSTLTISIFEPHSIYAMRLARQGKLLTHHTDRSILTLMTLSSLIEKEYTAVTPDMPLNKLVRAFSDSHTSFMPVLDKAGTLLGEVDMTRNRHIIFRTELYNRFRVEQLMSKCPATIGVNDPMDEAMHKFEKTNAQYLPVVDMSNHLVGYIDRTRMYSMYRKMVADFSAE